MDALTYLVRTKRKLEQRVTNANRKSIINLANKLNKEYGFERISKNASVKEIVQARNKVNERLGYDVLTLAVEEGNTVIASVESRELKKAKDKETKQLAQYSSKLANAKKQAMKGLSKDDIELLEDSNINMLGFGNDNVMKMFEKAKGKKAVESFIDTLSKQNTKEMFYDKNLDLLDTVFQRVGVTREDDLDKVKEALSDMDFDDLINNTNYLLQTVELYPSPQLVHGKADTETELADARLDDIMIRLNLKKEGKQKVNAMYKKYKADDKTKKK